jgi:hypothetical protein
VHTPVEDVPGIETSRIDIWKRPLMFSVIESVRSAVCHRDKRVNRNP